MKTKSFILSAACLALSLMASCSNDPVDDKDFASWDASAYLTNDVLYPKNAKLKRVIFSPVWEKVYQYDAKGRIDKILYGSEPEYLQYDIYAFNETGLLSDISNYYKDILVKKTVFSYDDSGNKIKEETKPGNDPELQGNPSSVTYSYNNGKLVKSEEYFQYLNGEISHFVKKYEYNNDGELIREKLYDNDENDYSTTEYYYHGGLMYYSITYYKDKVSGFCCDSRRTYDLNGNLVKQADNIPGLSSSMAPDGKQPAFIVTTEYEYYQ